jgi:hypothetical protein
VKLISAPHTKHNEGAGGCNEDNPNAAIKAEFSTLSFLLCMRDTQKNFPSNFNSKTKDIPIIYTLSFPL